MTLGITRSHGLLSRWKRPICELLQQWRKNLASLVFFVIILINLFGVTLGTVDKGSKMVVVKHALVLEGSIGVKIKDTTGFSGNLGVLYNNYNTNHRKRRGVKHRNEDNMGIKNNNIDNNLDKSCISSSQSSSHISLKDIFKQIISNLTDSMPSLAPELSSQCLQEGYNRYTQHQIYHPEPCSNIPKNSSSIKSTSTNVDRPNSKIPTTTKEFQNITSEVCSVQATWTKKDAVKTRLQELRKKTLPFCSMFYVVSAIDKCDEKCTNEKINGGDVNTCENCIDAVLKLDQAAYAMYSHFQRAALEHFDCRDDFTSMHWSCGDCEEAYKNWLCSMTIPFYRLGELIPPCSNYCEEVEKKCPYILPQLENQYVGQPTFLCTVPDIPIQTFSIYSQNSVECHNLSATGQVKTFSYTSPIKDSSDTLSQSNQTPSQTLKTTLPNQSYSQNNDANQRTPSSTPSNSDKFSDNKPHLTQNTDGNDISSDSNIKQDLNSKTRHHSDTSQSIRINSKLEYSDNAGRTIEPWEKATSVSTEENTYVSAGGSLHHRHWLMALAQALVVLIWDYWSIVTVLLSLFHASGNT